MWKTEIVEKWKTLRKQAACCGNTVDKKNMINKGDNGFFHNFHIWWKSGKHPMWKNGGKLLTFTHQRRRRPEMNVSKRYFPTQKWKTGVSDSCLKRDGSRWANRTGFCAVSSNFIDFYMEIMYNL